MQSVILSDLHDWLWTGKKIQGSYHK